MIRDTDMPSPSGLKAWRSEVSPGGAPEVMRKVLEQASAKGAEVLVADGVKVFGKEHLASATFHARRAIDEGRNSSDSLAIETLLYASGERQLSGAIDKMGVNEETIEVVVALLSDTEFEMDDSWKELPSIAAAPSIDRLAAFGVTEEELETVPPDERVELVLEKVAAVDLSKK